jgi:hypothetical protein
MEQQQSDKQEMIEISGAESSANPDIPEKSVVSTSAESTEEQNITATTTVVQNEDSVAKQSQSPVKKAESMDLQNVPEEASLPTESTQATETTAELSEAAAESIESATEPKQTITTSTEAVVDAVEPKETLATPEPATETVSESVEIVAEQVIKTETEVASDAVTESAIEQVAQEVTETVAAETAIETKIEIDEPQVAVVLETGKQEADVIVEDQKQEKMEFEEEKVEAEEKMCEEAPKELVPNMELFKSVRYFVISTDDSQVETELEARGAKKDPYLSTFITHVICDSLPDPDSLLAESYLDAKDIYDLTIVQVSTIFIQFFLIILFLITIMFAYCIQIE